MSLFEFVFPDRNRAARQARRAAYWQAQFEETEKTTVDISDLQARIFSLERDVGFLTLVLGSILEIANDDGLLTRDRIKQKIQSLDTIDGFRDGGLDINILRYLLYQMNIGAVVPVNTHDEVYYWNEATKDDARDLGRILTNYGVFGDKMRGSSVDLAAANGEYILSFILGDDAWEDSEVIDYYNRLGEKLASERFGYPLSIDLCNEALQIQTTLRIE